MVNLVIDLKNQVTQMIQQIELLRNQVELLTNQVGAVKTKENGSSQNEGLTAGVCSAQQNLKKKKIHGSWGKCLRAGFRTPVEGKRGTWAG